TGFDENEILRLAASLERASEHPLAAAVVSAARKRNLALSSVEDFDSPGGKGATGSVDGRKIIAGNRTIMADANIDTTALDQAAGDARRDGATAIFVA